MYCFCGPEGDSLGWGSENLLSSPAMPRRLVLQATQLSRRLLGLVGGPEVYGMCRASSPCGDLGA